MRAESATDTEPDVSAQAAAPAELDRRGSGRRGRARDRLMDRPFQASAPAQGHEGDHNIENLILLIDDDLRETALAIERIEGYLSGTLRLLDVAQLSSEQIAAHALSPAVIDHVDALGETLESLRRRLARLAARLR